MIEWLPNLTEGQRKGALAGLRAAGQQGTKHVIADVTFSQQHYVLEPCTMFEFTDEGMSTWGFATGA
jgi:hypothetical protein